VVGLIRGKGYAVHENILHGEWGAGHAILSLFILKLSDYRGCRIYKKDAVPL